MNTIQHGLRSYRSHDVGAKASSSSHPLDILSDILFDIKTENRRRESQEQAQSRANKNPQEENFRDVLKRELSK